MWSCGSSVGMFLESCWYLVIHLWRYSAVQSFQKTSLKSFPWPLTRPGSTSGHPQIISDRLWSVNEEKRMRWNTEEMLQSRVYSFNQSINFYYLIKKKISCKPKKTWVMCQCWVKVNIHPDTAWLPLSHVFIYSIYTGRYPRPLHNPSTVNSSLWWLALQKFLLSVYNEETEKEPK